MLVEFQNTFLSDAGSAGGVMPSKFCSGNICCDNHRRQKIENNGDTECKEFVIIGKRALKYSLNGVVDIGY